MHITKISFTSLLLILSFLNLSAQQPLTSDKKLEEDLIRTGIIHSPLSLDESKSFENSELKKKILYNEPLYKGEYKTRWSHFGLGEMTFSDQKTLSGNQSVRLAYQVNTGKRAQGSPSDPDYATYGNASVSFDAKEANWEKYNRIEFYIYPDCEGARVVNMDLSFENDNTIKKESYNPSSGSHLINLKNKEWNRCFLNIGEYQRDKVIKISFSHTNRGKDRTTGDSAIYYIDKIELQQIENPEIVSGWIPGYNRIVYSTSGYMLNDKKTAIANLTSELKNKTFQLIKAENNSVVFEGKIKQEKTTIGEFDILDFTSFNQPGLYRLKAGDISTNPFSIDQKIWDNSLWRVLNFIFCQRCGYPVPGKHGTCHIDLCSKHDGKSISYAGGWHDAGDLSQQTLQTGDVTFALLESYNKLKDTNPLLAARLLEEAEWGLEFVLRNRYGDGYHASSVGLIIWLDGIFGTKDDISSVRVQNSAFDNFLYSGYEAYAALTIDRDPRLQEYVLKVAKEDFDFAMKRHKEVGYGEFIHFYEHSYNTSESQYMATASWAASMLYKLTKDPYYANKATEFIKYTLECQRKEPVSPTDIKGFFYRDKSKKVIVHYNHQSREQVYMQAMALLCETQPQHTDYSKWVESIKLYAGYLKSIMPYTAPYGMIASGVYHIDEAKDDISFKHSHLFVGEEAKSEYPIQVQKGVRLDNEHYLKRFPVWFSIFNGNAAVHLSMGKAAAICGNFLKDKELLSIAREQLYWTVGKNPFGQSLIYGEGYNYPQMDSFSSGEIVGEIPVGIRTLGNEDIPYWPQKNNATYKEVWITSAGKWLTLIAEID